jgi:hypothetical protein
MISHTLADGGQRASRGGTPAAVCHHLPRCPAASASDRDAAHTVAAHPEQGWSLLCNGVVLFEDTGELLPGGQALPPRRARFALFGQIAAA